MHSSDNSPLSTTSHDTMSAKEPVQYLTFTLDQESFATEIAQVREVLEYSRVTKVPRTPDFMRGVINLRGSVVPVLDLRLQFGVEATEPTIDTCIIIVEVVVDGQTTILGALADSVQEVIELSDEHLEPAPSLGTQINVEFIKAMAKYDDHFVMILDVNRVFSAEQLVAAQAGASGGANPVDERSHGTSAEQSDH